MLKTRTHHPHTSSADAPPVSDAKQRGVNLNRDHASQGQPLPAQQRATLEARFGHSFENVRVHADESAHDLALSFDARAFTYGDEVFFRSGEYAPETSDGFKLLAHEAAHVVQHAGSTQPGSLTARLSEPSDTDEVAAKVAADAVTEGRQANVAAAQVSAPVISRWPWSDDAGGGGSAWDTVSSIGSSALALGNDVGKSIGDAESSAFNAILSHPAAVAESTSSLNKSWGGLVDSAENSLSNAGKSAVEATSDIPVLGGIVQGGAMFANVAGSSLGGVAKGVGDLVTAGTNAAANPLAPIEGILGMAEHTPGFAGTMLKGAHGLYDIATGNEKGEYGANMGELWQNLGDGDKQNEQDLKFWAQLGGGEKAWSDNPIEAASRTATNLLPMVLGELVTEPVGPRVIEPTEFGPQRGAGKGVGPEVPRGSNVEGPNGPNSEGPPSTKRTPFKPEGVPDPPEFNPNIEIFPNEEPLPRLNPDLPPLSDIPNEGPVPFSQQESVVPGSSRHDIPWVERPEPFEPLRRPDQPNIAPESPNARPISELDPAFRDLPEPDPSTLDRPLPSTEDPLPSTLDRPVPSTLDRPLPSTLDRPSPSTLDRPIETQPRPAITPLERALRLYHDAPEVEFGLTPWDGVRRKGF